MSPANTEFEGNKKNQANFSIQGKIKEAETGRGVSGFTIEVVDKDGTCDDRLGSTITDDKGYFELTYGGADFKKIYFEEKPDLFIRVTGPDGKEFHTTEEKVRYGANKTKAFTINIPREKLKGIGLSPIKNIKVSPVLAKADDTIEVAVTAQPSGRVRFSIARIYGATDIAMEEDPEKSGAYVGKYTVQVGDNVSEAMVSIVFSAENDQLCCTQARQRVTIDTIPPHIREFSVGQQVIRNGQYCTVKVVAETGCSVEVDLAQLDSTKKLVSLTETPNNPGRYTKQIRIGLRNKAANGEKTITVVARDRAGNQSEPAVATVELRNSEIETIATISRDNAAALNKAGIFTLADLRKLDDEKLQDLARKTHLPAAEIAQHRSSARMQTLGLPADVALALVKSGDILSVSQLALTPLENIDAILQRAIEEGTLAAGRIAGENPSKMARHTAVEATDRMANAAAKDIKTAIDSCVDACPGEFSVFSCYAYLLELIGRSGMSYAQLYQAFKQDFLNVTSAPRRRIDISIIVLENALHDMAGNAPPRLSSHWQTYDDVMNVSLLAILSSSLVKSEAELPSCFPNQQAAFDKNRPPTDCNNDLSQILYNLYQEACYWQALKKRLMQRTGESEAVLSAKYPAAFDQVYSTSERNQAMEKILDFSSPTSKVEKVQAELASLKLEALIKQSGKSASQLRQLYYISFSASDCSATSTCRQAALSLQEYFEDKKITYPSYDEWYLDQTKMYYPENIYSHQFKTSLIRGDQQLLKQHLDQARKIMDEVRVSVDGNEPQEDDLLNSFRWRNPYYTNLKAGMDLIQACWEIDDLMVRGHQAFLDEEYQQARTHYLDAEKKIRSASQVLSKPMGDILPLNTTDGKDSYFVRNPLDIKKAAKKYFENLVLSYTPENTPGIDMARGPVTLKGVDTNGTFKPMFHPGLDKSGWISTFAQYSWEFYDFYKNNRSYWSVDELGYLDYDQKGGHAHGGLVYKGKNFKDVAVEIEVAGNTHSIDSCFRWRPLEKNLGYSASLYYGNTQTTDEMIGEWKLIQGLVVLGWIKTRKTATNYQKIRIRYELIGDKLKVKYWQQKDGFWDAIGSFPENETLAPVLLKDISSTGALAIMGSAGTIYSIKAWDLDSSEGAFSDLAFFLYPTTRVYPFVLTLSYIYRAQTPTDTKKVAKFGQSLPLSISIPYQEGNEIIENNAKDRDSFDPLFSQGALTSYGLWYSGMEKRLSRRNLQALLDGLPMLFCHQFFFLLPVCLGDIANAMGQFDEARTWYRMVFDEPTSGKDLEAYPFLNKKIEGEMLRLRISQNYVEWADYLFNQNTEESVHQARINYRKALRTQDTLKCCEDQQNIACNMHDLGTDLSHLIVSQIIDAKIAVEIYAKLTTKASLPGQSGQVKEIQEEVQKIATGDAELVVKATQLATLLEEKLSVLQSHPPLFGLVERENTLPERLYRIEQRYPRILDETEENIRMHRELDRIAEEKGTLASVPALEVQTENVPALPTPPRATVPSVDGGSAAIDAVYVPYEVYKDTSLRQRFEQIGPFIGLPGKWIPALPALPQATEPGRTFSIDRRYDLCVPTNPVVVSLSRRACLGIYLIDHCFNALGLPQNDLSIYRFDYLVSMARNFAQMALAAEKDFIQFKDQFEKDLYELMSASQATAVSQANVRLAQLKIKEALNLVAGAELGIEKVNTQIVLTRQRIDELGSDWAIFGIVLGTIAAAASAFVTAGASVAAIAPVIAIAAGGATALGGAATYMSGKEDNEESLRQQLRLLETVELNAARQNLSNAIDAERTASQQARIAELEARFAAEKAKFLDSEFFNPQLWSFLAREVKKNYRIYLSYGNIAGWLAQRALEFERGIEPRRLFASTGPDESGAGLNVVRFDYFQPSQHGLLGADNLLRDIATLENEKFLNEQRKLTITKVISLAGTRPFLFAHFLETGRLPFSTTLDEFDQDFPGHYQRRIRSVRVNLFGLVGPEGIKATLRSLGTSRVVVREITGEGTQFVEKTLRRPGDNLALTSPSGGGIGQIQLTPKEPLLNPFEDMGVAAHWFFEMPKYANRIDYNTITDIQILIDYSAFEDRIYRKEVIERLPVTQTAIRAYSFCAEFSDACFHFKDQTRPLGMIQTADVTTGAYTLMLQTQASDYPPNQKNRWLKEVVIYFRSKGTEDYSDLELRLTCKQWLDAHLPPLSVSDLTPASFKKAELPPANEKAKTKLHYLGKWQASVLTNNVNLQVADTWYLHISPDAPNNTKFVKLDANNQPVLVNGHKIFDFSGVQDVIFALHYAFDVEKPEA